MTDSSLDLDKVAAAISALGLGVDPAELHGGICGLLCTRGPGAVAAWIRASGQVPESPIGDSDAVMQPLHDAESEAWRELSGAALGFYPMLPGAELTLAERVAALASWCHGFLAGLGLGGFSLEDVAYDDNLDREQLTEILNDLSEISQVGLDADDLDDATQADFDLAALVEYVRVGVQLIFEQLHARREGDASAAELQSMH